MNQLIIISWLLVALKLAHVSPNQPSLSQVEDQQPIQNFSLHLSRSIQAPYR